jgi:hypothetical protein
MLVTMHQLSYLPWMGLIQRIKKADVFLCSDIAPYSHNEYQNRNRIKTPKGLQWLTVPVHRKQVGVPIREVVVDNSTDWGMKHWKAIKFNYGQAKYFKDHARVIEELYRAQYNFLSEVSTVFLGYSLSALGVVSRTVFASSLNYTSGIVGKTEWIIDKLQAFDKGGTYLSGQNGESYLDLGQFAAAGISVQFHKPEINEYRQLWGEFTPYACCLDYIFNCVPGRT